MNPSMRTRTSFELGMQQLGGIAIVLQPGKDAWGVEFNPGVVMDGDAEEHIAEVAGVLSRYLIAGELSLDGSLRPVHGVLPMALKARELGLGVIVPAQNAAEAAVIEHAAGAWLCQPDSAAAARMPQPSWWLSIACGHVA